MAYMLQGQKSRSSHPKITFLDIIEAYFVGYHDAKKIKDVCQNIAITEETLHSDYWIQDEFLI